MIGIALCSVALCCGGGDNGSGAAISACNSFCAAFVMSACVPAVYASALECESDRCATWVEAPAACQERVGAYYACLNKQPDVCSAESNACADEFSAAFSTCNR